jgi:hypothetical protein
MTTLVNFGPGKLTHLAVVVRTLWRPLAHRHSTEAAALRTMERTRKALSLKILGLHQGKLFAIHYVYRAAGTPTVIGEWFDQPPQLRNNPPLGNIEGGCLPGAETNYRGLVGSPVVRLRRHVAVESLDISAIDRFVCHGTPGLLEK